MSARGQGPGGGSLSDFKELKLLGEGAFSAVYKVRRLADGETYALKKVKLPSLTDKEKRNALNEIRLLASVRHENVISYRDAFFDDRTRCLCIILECVDGGDLFQLIETCGKERRTIPEVDIWRYMIGLCHGLSALHGIKILHRDLKSANVFLHGSPKVAKLGDFNVSTVAKRGLCVTQTGTPYYASPEVWRDMPYDGQSDLWSLGCVLYESAALKPPFRGKDMEGLYKKVLQGKYKRIPDQYSDALSDVVGALLQVNPRHRPSAAQLLDLPVVRSKVALLGLTSGATDGPCAEDLLQTIKVPKKLVDLSTILPRPQYGDSRPEGEDEEKLAQAPPLGSSPPSARAPASSRATSQLPSARSARSSAGAAAPLGELAGSEAPAVARSAPRVAAEEVRPRGAASRPRPRGHRAGSQPQRRRRETSEGALACRGDSDAPPASRDALPAIGVKGAAREGAAVRLPRIPSSPARLGLPALAGAVGAGRPEIMV